ncbi:hypothetical protein PLICRDRAFT_46407 [Plicaturopsis crispa FD-325 SS-3]|uniref:Unplaced genomic scaffold PLICRscaffold_19, whole genome shotgun sequence n=1 Tax=Plicaturopsis crispa FD-325 SS-3 TaxID=944288 RepID=A0A0C9T422_PLICR|nr:hypothetical protein PLICRDRAFT_46407 [Plicaturopsis crispa FD-325 SS-3]
MADKRFRVAICGAGVGGMVCALALARDPSIEVELYEATSRFGEIGAGIGIWPRTWKILEQLHVAEDLVCVLPAPPAHDTEAIALTMRRSDKPEGHDFHKLKIKGSLVVLHRADFHRVLLKHLPPQCKTHLSKRLLRYSQDNSGSIHLQFNDGSTAICDVLVGADGLKSAVRATLLDLEAQAARVRGDAQAAGFLESCIVPKWSGEVSYRTLVPAIKLREKVPNHRALTHNIQYIGRGGYIVAYPISKGETVNFVAFRTSHELKGTEFNGPWVTNVSAQEFQAGFDGWEAEVTQLLQCAEKGMRWAIHEVKPLQSFVSGRVALIGDAAHAMTPNQGSGAGQAIEDAYILATVLGNPLTSIDAIPEALTIYDTIRRPFAQDIAERSFSNGLLFSFDRDNYESEFPDEESKRNKLKELRSSVTEQWKWAWSTTLDGAVAEANERLQKAHAGN